jgi:hypothetical protein
MGREAACRRSTRPCLILLAAIFSLGFTKTAEALSSSGGGGRSSLRLAGGKCDCQDFGQKGQSLRALVLDRGDACVLVHRLRGGHRTRWDLFKHLLSRYDTDKDSFLSRDEVGKTHKPMLGHARDGGKGSPPPRRPCAVLSALRAPSSSSFFALLTSRSLACNHTRCPPPI